MKRIVLCYMVFAMLLLASCAPIEKPSGGIEIVQVDVVVGRAEGGGNQQVVSYNVTLHNATQNEVIIRWMKPVPNNAISSRIVGEDQRVMIDRVLAPDASLVASGHFTFDAGNATKSEINSWKPFFNQVSISTELELPLPSQTGN